MPSLNVNIRSEQHNAPTIESVKLLRDMEKEAEERVLSRFRSIGDSTLAVSATTMYSLGSPEATTIVHYNLNGKQRRIELPCVSYAGPLRQIAVEIRDAIAKDLAEVITLELMGY